ncbi:antitoxin Xre-like helix-turn-helix domain-containing protein [Epilithonimonas sp.]|uniref:antitoxin Xre-like helix-turn-helix domain-containing protein n=1 Tax=Epilithonimonas sp. TaxID=2894511 RepID=UPI00289A571A|nr:antitoxin Xre-like helix-turn-helix domain-containing protein [Epilithonimonas sp.]
MITNKEKNNSKKNRVEEPIAAYGTINSVFHKFAIKDDYKLLKKAREGLRTDVFYSLADAIKMPEKTLASVINLSPRTISNYRDQEKELDPIYSEHLLKLINLYSFGKEILGSLEEFGLWMNRPFWNSEDKPIDFISTSGGVDLIYEEIEKLAQGYPV